MVLTVRGATAIVGLLTAMLSTAACSSAAPPATSAPPATPSPTVDPLASIRSPMAELQRDNLIASINVGANPDWQAFGFGSMWVANSADAVVRIDAATNAVIASVPVSEPCLGLAVDAAAIWSVSCGRNEVDRIDPVTNLVSARVSIPGVPSQGEGVVVATAGSVWLFVDAVGTLVRIDAATNKISSTFHIGMGGVALVAANGSLWATAPDTDNLLQISLEGKVLKTIPVADVPRFLASGEGGIWVLGQATGALSHVDPDTGQVVATIALEVPGNGGCVGAGGGAVWVTMPNTPLTRIDAATNAVTRQFYGPGGDCISFADGSVWLSNIDLGTVWRLRP